MNPSDPPPSPIHPPPWFDALALTLEPFRGSGIVAAVSGGGDSVALLWALAMLQGRLTLRLSVATCDHSTRGGESARDAAFVADLARRLGLPCDLGHWRSDRPGGFEAEARRARYAWLAEVARSRGAEAVATGHTRDDQAETILHRVVRGTGLHGLAGMAPSRPLGPGLVLIRPLLEVSRPDLRAYLTDRGETWREDATNADLDRTRSRLRHDLLPRLAADYNPAVAEALVRLGTLAADASARLDRRSSRLLRRITVERGEGWITLDRGRLRHLGPGDRVDLLRAAWRVLGWPERRMTHARWLRLDASAAGLGPQRLAIAAGIEAIGTPDRWMLWRVGPPVDSLAQAPLDCLLPIPGSTNYLGGRLVAALDDGPEPAPVSIAGLIERLDADRILGACLIRSPLPGDRFDPLGMGGRSQALADLLRGRGVMREDRARVPIVADSAGIVWVVGHRIAHRVRRSDSTCRVLELRWEPPAEGGG